MRINIGLVIICFAVSVFLLAQYLDFSGLFAWLLAGIGASQLGEYWCINSKKGEKEK